MHAHMTAVTKQSNKFVSGLVKNDEAIWEPSTEKLNKCFGQSNIWCGVINCPLSRLVPGDILGLYFYSNLSSFPFISFRALVDLHDASVYCLAGHRPRLLPGGLWLTVHIWKFDVDSILTVLSRMASSSSTFQTTRTLFSSITPKNWKKQLTARSLKCGETQLLFSAASDKGLSVSPYSVIWEVSGNAKYNIASYLISLLSWNSNWTHSPSEGSFLTPSSLWIDPSSPGSSTVG